MADTSTVSGLVARFALRRRADSSAFADGVRLAMLGAVTLNEWSRGVVRATVEDGHSFDVKVFAAADGQLLGECPCSPGNSVPCRHQVAVAHVVWVKGRRGIAT